MDQRRVAIRCAIRVVSTFVLPLPAPATIIIGPSRCNTASRCGHLIPINIPALYKVTETRKVFRKQVFNRIAFHDFLS